MMDYWQLAAAAAAVLFNFSYLAQLKITFQSKSAQGVSLLQWLGFTIGSFIFVGFYIQLHQWYMVFVSIFGLVCCLLILSLLFCYRAKERSMV